MIAAERCEIIDLGPRSRSYGFDVPDANHFCHAAQMKKKEGVTQLEQTASYLLVGSVGQAAPLALSSAGKRAIRW